MVIFDNLPSALPYIKDKRLIALAVAAPKRLTNLPDIPTFKELGLEPVNRPAFYGIFGPKGMPKELVHKLNAALLKVLQDPAVVKRIEASGSKVIGNAPEQFAQQLRAEFEVYKKVVDAQKLKLD
jgi:tripartite-type tricarboxylate transporter receptor subunit TctC